CIWIKRLPGEPIDHRERDRFTSVRPRNLRFARRSIIANANALIVDLVFERRTFSYQLKRIRLGYPAYNHTENPLFFAKLGARPTNRKHGFARARVVSIDLTAIITRVSRFCGKHFSIGM